MTIKVVILRSAQTDLQQLKHHLVKKFGKAAWQKSYSGIKEAVVRMDLRTLLMRRLLQTPE